MLEIEAEVLIVSLDEGPRQDMEEREIKQSLGQHSAKRISNEALDKNCSRNGTQEKARSTSQGGGS